MKSCDILSIHVVCFALSSCLIASFPRVSSFTFHHQNVHQRHQQKQSSNTSLQAEYQSIGTRRQTLQHIINFVPAVLITTTSVVPLANADDSDLATQLSRQTSLRYVKRAIKEMEKLEFYVVNNDYTEVKSGLRSPAITELRKSATMFIRQTSVETDQEALSAKYGAFIKSLEALDGQSSLGLRGRKNIEMYSAYDTAMKDLKSFVEYAEPLVQTTSNSDSVTSSE